MKKILFATLVVGIVGVFINRMYSIVSDRSEMDHLHEILAPVKEKLKLQPHLSLVANRNDKALFYRTQFILTPTVVVEHHVESHPLVLFIQNIGKKKVELPVASYDTLHSFKDDKFELLLLNKSDVQ